MSTTHLISFALYLAVVATLIYFGARYVLQTSWMPYHEAALKRPWSSLEPSLQALLLGMQKNMGAGMLACGVAGMILLLVPFRAGLPWASWALLSILLVNGIPTLYATAYIRSQTGANTPVLPTAAGLVLGVLAFLLSLA